ncbi:MAG: hypothetical protein V3V02_08930 [Rhizobiaceae bacterium]
MLKLVQISVFLFSAMALFLGATLGQENKPEIDIKVQVPDTPKPKPFELAKGLDGLFAQLKRTGDTKRAKKISTRIWEQWQKSDSRSVDLLTHWAREASGESRYGQALDLLDQVVVLRPDYAEGYNQRATLHYQMKNFGKSIADIERTLSLEPRHYGALAGMASILEQLGDKKKALATWYRALAVYPAMRSAQNSVLRLEEQLAGNGI